MFQFLVTLTLLSMSVVCWLVLILTAKIITIINILLYLSYKKHNITKNYSLQTADIKNLLFV